jgi:Spy/CpxP family protein refolding chaperone
MKKGILAGVATALVVIGGSVAFNAVEAIETKNILIDKDFEVAVRKHLEKRLYNLLDASDAQQEKISKLLGERAEETRPEREKIREGLVDLSNMLGGDTQDDAIVAKVHELRAMHEQVMDEGLSTLLKVREVLSPSQRKIVSDKMVSILSGGGLRH